MPKITCEKCRVQFKSKKLYLEHLKDNCSCFKKKDSEKSNELKFIDLFAGTGAFTLALEKSTKFKCVFANDMMTCSKNIYELNNPTHTFTLKDLNTINVSDIPSPFK